MKEIIKYNKVHISINVKKKLLKTIGLIGLFEKNFNGNFSFYFNNKIFFLTQVDMRVFLNILHKMCRGVSFGYYIEINFVGLSYRFLKIKNFLLLKLGFSHYIKYIIPSGIHIIGYKRKLIIYGINIIEVNKIAQQLQFFKKPSIYKGKGIQIAGEILRIKVGKQK